MNLLIPTDIDQFIIKKFNSYYLYEKNLYENIFLPKEVYNMVSLNTLYVMNYNEIDNRLINLQNLEMTQFKLIDKVKCNILKLRNLNLLRITYIHTYLIDIYKERNITEFYRKLQLFLKNYS